MKDADHGSFITHDHVDRFAAYLSRAAKKYTSAYAKSKLGSLGSYAVDNYWPWDRKHVPNPEPPKGKTYAPGLHPDT